MIKRHLGCRPGLIVGLFLAMGVIGVVGPSDIASAAPEPDANGVYRYLELAPPNTFRAYARPGETIHFTVFAGERSGTAANSQEPGLCSRISLKASDNTILSGARITGIQYNGAALNSTGAAIQSTCGTSGANADRPMQRVTVSYTVPAAATPITSMAGAYQAAFEDWTRSGAMVQGYEWRIRVNNNPTDPNVDSGLTGRVWFVGDQTGISVWQNNIDGNLIDNQSTHSFRYVRDDGYRYAVRYNDYHGIWSDFHGGVYGARLNTGNNVPVYRSYDQDQDDGDFLFRMTGVANLAYVFVDCPWGDLSCPATLPIARTQPITSNAPGVVETVGGNTYTADATSGNPIADVNDLPSATNNYRYTGYTPASNLAGGRVTVPYIAMQSGTIRLRVSQNGTLLCQRDFLVDDPDGAGIAGANPNGSNPYTWQFQQDPACSSGTLQTANVPNIPLSDVLTITAQAIRLGEMHFIEADTERRGGIEVRGNGLGTPAQLRSVAWYDPFSRTSGDTCGSIPPAVGSGSPVAASSGRDSASSTQEFLYTGTNIDGSLGGAILPLSASTVTPANGYRNAVDSGVAGGVHGWTSVNGCYGSNTNGGYSNNDGTATSVSTWGNDRVIDDWTYAFRNPPARVLSIGGPIYTLTPSVIVAPGTTIGVGEQATFTMSVRNQSALYPSNDTDWVIRRIAIPPGGTLNTAARNPANATDFSCGYYTSVGGGVTCDDTNPAFSGTRIFPAGTSTTVGTNNETGGIAIGSRICYALTVNSFNQRSRPNFAEAVTCVTIAKSPQLEARNGDVFAGGQFASANNALCTVTDRPIIASSQRQISSTYYTSYATYGVTSLGSATTFGSMGLSYGSSASADNLVFANNPANQGYFYNTTGSGTGLPATGHCLNDPFAIFGPRTATNNVGGTSIRLDTLGSSNINLTASGTVTLYTNAPIPAGTKIVIYAKNADIRIASNIQYADQDGGPGYSDISRIPQIVILTDHNIVVQENAQGGALSTGGKVSQLDGIYAAKDNFYTCEVVPRLHTCEAVLTVNGAVVIGKNVIPLRTYGADSVDFSRKAEIFNLRLDMFVNQLPQVGSPDVFIKTLSETEVPPRF